MEQSETVDWKARLHELEGPAAPQRTQLRAHDHAPLVYWGRQEFLDTIVPFLLDGLRAGDLVVHVAHEEPLPPVVEALEAAGVNVAAAVAAGDLQLLTAAEAFAPEGAFDVEQAMAGIKSLIETAQTTGARQVRFSVAISYVLSGVPGIEDFMIFDARANDEIFPRYPFICICAYNAAKGVNDLVEDMFGTHLLVFVRGIPLANPYYRPWKEISAHAAHLQRWKERYSAAAHCEFN